MNSINSDMKKKEFSEFTGKMDYELQKLIKYYGVPGVAISIIHKGDIILSKCYGYADKKSHKKIDASTCFQVASISKSITAWGMMKLVENMKVDLDTPIEKYLTRWKFPQSKFSNNEVTIRRLLSHTAGVSVPGYLGTLSQKGLHSLEESLLGTKSKNTRVTLIEEAGGKFLYSGGGYTLLQLIIEEVTGTSFSTFMKNEVLNPLGMNSSTFEWNSSINIASAYGVLGFKVPNYLFVEKAAAGLYTNVCDLSKFLQANFVSRLGGDVLKPDTVALIHTRINRMIPYGLGNYVINLPNNNRAIISNGENRGWRADLVALPFKDQGIVIMSNSNNGINIAANILSQWFEWTLGSTAEYYLNMLKVTKRSKIGSLYEQLNAIYKINRGYS